MPPTRNNAEPCEICLNPACSPYAAGLVVTLGVLLSTATSARGVWGGDGHKFEIFILYLTGFELSRHLRHFDANREEAVEGLLLLLYERFYIRYSRPDMARIFIALRGDSGRVGLGLGVVVGVS